MFNPNVWLVKRNADIEQAITRIAEAVTNATKLGVIRWAEDPLSRVAASPRDVMPLLHGILPRTPHHPAHRVVIGPATLRLLVHSAGSEDEWDELFHVEIGGEGYDEESALHAALETLLEAALAAAEELAEALDGAFRRLDVMRDHAVTLWRTAEKQREQVGSGEDEDDEEEVEVEIEDEEDPADYEVDDAVEMQTEGLVKAARKQAAGQPTPDQELAVLPGTLPIHPGQLSRERRPVKKKPPEKREGG